MPKFNDHIDELDAFYQSSFEDGEMTPPDDMWDRIEASYEKQKAPQKKPAAFYTKRNFWLMVGAALLLLLLLLFFTSSSSEQRNEGKPDNKNTENTNAVQRGANTNESTTIESESNAQRKNNSATASEKNKNTNDNSSASNNAVNTKTADTVVTPTTQTATPMEVVAAPDTVKKAEPKKKLRFREKHTEALKDSARPLFVPAK